MFEYAANYLLNGGGSLKPLLQTLKHKKYVFLGASTHGTSEFFLWRSEITRQLIAHHGFSFVAVEAADRDCQAINRYLLQPKSPYKVQQLLLQTLKKWPTWLWANLEMADLIEWLRRYNHQADSTKRIGFHGLQTDEYQPSISSERQVDWQRQERQLLRSLQKLQKDYPAGAKGVIWGHNDHIGDARSAVNSTQPLSLGSLARQVYGSHQVALIGFSTYAGEVISAKTWGEPMKVMDLPAAEKGSWEYLLHSLEASSRYYLFPAQVGFESRKKLGHRSVGHLLDTVFPKGRYVPTVLDQCYDALVFLDKTIAVHPLRTQASLTFSPASAPSFSSTQQPKF